jgi:hypothetical protein
LCFVVVRVQSPAYALDAMAEDVAKMLEEAGFFVEAG